MMNIIELRHRLHSFAELSGEEVKTMEILKEFIRKNTNFEIVDKGKYFYAYKLKGESCKNIAFRADMDALPIDEGNMFEYSSLNRGVAHKCGHDGHCAMLCGFALECDKMEINKNVFLLFQPSEEIGKGSKICLDFIRENNIDEIYGFHNIPGFRKNTLLIKYGTFACASTGIEISLEGKITHAAYPENGINPSFAISEIINEVSNINNEKYKGLVLATIVGINVGKEAYGSAAGQGKIMITLRGEIQEEYLRAKERLCNFAESSAKKYGLSININFIEEFGATVNDKMCLDKVVEICKNIDKIILNEPFRWSEDFGEYLRLTKGCFMGIGDGEKHPQLHTIGYDFPDEIMETGINVMKGIVENG